jgi:histidinol dehydrogenase
MYTTTKMRFMPGTRAYKAFHAMLDKVRAENTHLSEQELDAKLCQARDDYCRQLRYGDATSK